MSRNVAYLAARLSTLNDLAARVQHVHGLVEQFASAVNRGAETPLVVPLRRAFGQLKVTFLAEGMDSLSQLAGSLEIAAGRGATPSQKLRVLREGVGSMRQQIEVEQRTILRDLNALRESQEKATSGSE